MELEPLVLVVDDDRSAREGYAELLEGRGFRVAVAGSADEAKASCRQRQPDAVITDVALPDGNGFDLAADLRRECLPAHAPILGMTGYWATDVHERAARAGVTIVLAKPCQPEHLLAELRRVLRSSVARDR
jgi:DNA-binding response OmpR family regulator